MSVSDLKNDNVALSKLDEGMKTKSNFQSLFADIKSKPTSSCRVLSNMVVCSFVPSLHWSSKLLFPIVLYVTHPSLCILRDIF